VSIGDDSPTRRIHGWAKRLEESPTGNEPFLGALERLRQLVDNCPEIRHLVHSDLPQNNVLVTEDEISGLIDWGCSLYGDLLYDHAWLAFWAPWFPEMQGIDFVSVTIRHLASVGLATDDVEERMRCYQIHIGLEAQSYNAFVGSWDWLARTARRTLALTELCS